MGLLKWVGVGLAAKGIQVANKAVDEWHESSNHKKNSGKKSVSSEKVVIIEKQIQTKTSDPDTPLKCPACGALLKSDSGRAIAFCPYCGAEIKQEKSDLDKILEHERFKKEHEEKVRQQKVKESDQSDKRIFIGLGAAAVAIVLLIMFTVVLPHRIRAGKMESLSKEIQQDILADRLDEAWVKTTQLRLDDGYSSDENKKWNDIRKDLQRMIIEKRGNHQENCSHEWYLTGDERDTGALLWKTHQREYICSQCGLIEWRDEK